VREHHYLITLGRIAQTGLSNFIRNAWLSTAATAIMVVTLTLLLSTVILNKALGDTIDDIARDITVSVYLKDDAVQDDLDSLHEALSSNPEVESVSYITKEEAQARYLARNHDNPDLIEAISIVGNAFPASYEVELKDLSDNDQLVGTATGPRFAHVVDKFDETRLQTVSKVGDAQAFITRTGLIAAILFAIISILVIFNTIRMTIFTRSDEIKIMRLIGATNGYVRGPFLFESMLYGIFAAIVALLLVYTTLNTLGPKVNRHVYFEPTIDLFAQWWWLVASTTVTVGMLIGVVSSLLAAARYMKK
jgi:cell division transport system permease protein